MQLATYAKHRNGDVADGIRYCGYRQDHQQDVALLCVARAEEQQHEVTAEDRCKDRHGKYSGDQPESVSCLRRQYADITGTLRE